MNSIILSGMAWASTLRSAIASRIGEERGQDLLEYAILAGGIAIALGAILIANPFNFEGWRKNIDSCIFLFNNKNCGK